MFGLGAVAAVTQACTLGSDQYIQVKQSDATEASDGGASSSSSGGAAAGGSCSGGKFTKPDVSKLKACKPGGHCYDKSKAPVAYGGIFTAGCDSPNELCIPDEVLSAGGEKLKSCKQVDSLKSMLGETGACINLSLVPEMAERGGSVLKQQDCAAGQVCAPCKDPEHGGAETPFCQPAGVFEGTCSTTAGGGDAGAAAAAAKPQEACCTKNGKSAGVCMGESVLDDDQKEMISKDTCSDGNLCLPASLVSDKAVTCKVGFFLSGICMDTCFNSMMDFVGATGLLSDDKCSPTEVCVPCFAVEQMANGIKVPGCK